MVWCIVFHGWMWCGSVWCCVMWFGLVLFDVILLDGAVVKFIGVEWNRPEILG